MANVSELGRLANLGAEASVEQSLAALWSRHGATSPRRVLGATTYVLWDEVSRQLILVRDRLGCEPLFFAEREDTVAVAAEAVVAHRLAGVDGPPEVDQGALARHLIGIFPRPGRSYFRDVRSVAPGEIVEIGAGQGGHRACRRSYWSLPLPPPRAADEVAVELDETLARVLRETVEPGRFALTLSGGLDSPSIALRLAQDRAPGTVRTITWVSPQVSESDEGERARRIADHLGLRQELLDVSDLWPFSTARGPSPESPYRLHFAELWDCGYEWARAEGLRGLVTGAGGDHLFGFGGHGAYAYPDLLLTGRWWRLVAELAEQRRTGGRGLGWITYHQLTTPLLRMAMPKRKWGRALPPWLGRTATELLRHDPGLRPPVPPRASLPGRRHRWQILASPYTANVLVAMSQQASLYGLELRHPWLDHRLVELAVALPTSATVRAGRYKEVLRRSLAGALPDEVVERRGKTTPLALFHRGLRERARDQVEDLLTGMRAAAMGLVDEPSLRRSYRAYVDGRDDYSFYPAVTLEAWLRRREAVGT